MCWANDQIKKDFKCFVFRFCANNGGKIINSLKQFKNFLFINCSIYVNDELKKKITSLGIYTFQRSLRRVFLGLALRNV